MPASYLFVHFLEVDETFRIPFFVLGVQPAFDRGGSGGFFIKISDGITVTSVTALQLEIVIDHVFGQFGAVFLVGIDTDGGAEIDDMVGGVIVFEGPSITTATAAVSPLWMLPPANFT